MSDSSFKGFVLGATIMFGVALILYGLLNRPPLTYKQEAILRAYCYSANEAPVDIYDCLDELGLAVE